MTPKPATLLSRLLIFVHITCLTMMHPLLLIFAAFVAVTVANDCSYPCPTGFVANPICGQKSNGFGDDLYHTFSSHCVIDCHAAKNPTRAHVAISQPGTDCAALGHSEIRYPLDVASEFDFPYDAPQ